MKQNTFVITRHLNNHTVEARIERIEHQELWAVIVRIDGHLDDVTKIDGDDPWRVAKAIIDEAFTEVDDPSAENGRAFAGADGADAPERAAAKPVVPHSDGWFDALTRLDPRQAAMTKRIVSEAGSAEVCGVCGDAPANDYQLVGVDFAPDTPATIRLCRDCKSIREGSLGERLEAIG